MSPTGPSGRSDSRGFTFLELLVAVLILGMFTALVSVRIQESFSGGDLRLASRVVIGEVKRFRGKAAHTHREQVMALEIDGNSFYPLEGGAVDEETLARQGAVLPDGVFFDDVVTQREDAIEDGVARIRFFGDGRVEPALVYLRNTKDDVFTL
jgi:prepilin-type N-terminal cleavage/methylation domain-containing protein